MIAKSQYLDHSYSLLEDFIKLSILFLLVAFIYMFLSKMTEQIFLTMAPSESVLRSVVWWVASIFNLALAIAVSAIILPVALAAFVYIFAIWHGLSIRMENFVFRWNIFHYEVFYANPDILLAEYMNYKEWMGCRCSDFQRRVMKFKLRSR